MNTFKLSGHKKTIQGGTQYDHILTDMKTSGVAFMKCALSGLPKDEPIKQHQIQKSLRK